MSNISSHAHPVPPMAAKRTDRTKSGRVSVGAGMSVQKKQIASLFGGCMLGIMLGLPLSFMRPTAAPTGSITLALGQTTFDMPAAIVKDGQIEANAQRIDLVLNWPDFGAADPTTPDNTIWMTVLPAGTSVAPELWPSTIYARYIDVEVEELDNGLLRRKFRDGTPYAGETLYQGTTEQAFVARCSVEAGKNTCLSTFRRGTLDIMLRFGEERLGDWQALLDNADAILKKTRRRGLA